MRVLRATVSQAQHGCSIAGQQHYYGPAVDINHLLGNLGDGPGVLIAEGAPVESNERYYRRRAVEERMAAQRAMTEQARAWHAKLAEDFAARAAASVAMACTSTAA